MRTVSLRDLIAKGMADQAARDEIKASPSAHVRSGGISGGRSLNRADDFELAVAAAAGTRIIESDGAASDVWGSITNTDWRRRDGTLAAFSFRAAGDLIAAIRGEGDYMDWYCSGQAGYITEWFRDSMAFEGWTPQKQEDT